ncbi:MAG: FlgK family flagellar hook-associated protein, partial [Tumebacillaceae bacterium]
MTSTFMGLEIGKRGLFATQSGLNTVGHNITNANTPGYSRQRVNFDATPAMYYPGINNPMGGGQIGTGVVAGSIERVRDQFLDTQYRNENKGAGEWEVRQDAVSKLEAIFNEPSDTGLSKVLNNFYTAWQALGRDPENLPARSVVKQST